MAGAIGPRVLDVSESLRDQLERTIGLTAFRLEIQRPRQLTIGFQSEPHHSLARAEDPRHAWMLPDSPATLTVPIEDEQGLIALVTVQRADLASYPQTARERAGEIVAGYASRLVEAVTT